MKCSCARMVSSACARARGTTGCAEQAEGRRDRVLRVIGHGSESEGMPPWRSRSPATTTAASSGWPALERRALPGLACGMPRCFMEAVLLGRCQPARQCNCAGCNSSQLVGRAPMHHECTHTQAIVICTTLHSRAPARPARSEPSHITLSTHRRSLTNAHKPLNPPQTMRSSGKTIHTVRFFKSLHAWAHDSAVHGHVARDSSVITSHTAALSRTRRGPPTCQPAATRVGSL